MIYYTMNYCSKQNKTVDSGNFLYDPESERGELVEYKNPFHKVCEFFEALSAHGVNKVGGVVFPSRFNVLSNQCKPPKLNLGLSGESEDNNLGYPGMNLSSFPPVAPSAKASYELTALKTKTSSNISLKDLCCSSVQIDIKI